MHKRAIKEYFHSPDLCVQSITSSFSVSMIYARASFPFRASLETFQHLHV